MGGGGGGEWTKAILSQAPSSVVLDSNSQIQCETMATQLETVRNLKLVYRPNRSLSSKPSEVRCFVQKRTVPSNTRRNRPQSHPSVRNRTLLSDHGRLFSHSKRNVTEEECRGLETKKLGLVLLPCYSNTAVKHRSCARVSIIKWQTVVFRDNFIKPCASNS